jgi:uncharacterized protein involved in type VI secretion and phage assembly
VSDGFTTPTILIDGQALAPSFAPVGIDVARAVNRIPTAMVLIQAQGSLSSETPLMAGGPFAPAAEVEIKLRQGSGDDVGVLKGVVTALGVRTHDGLPTLEVVIKDKAIRLAGARHSRIWTDVADSDAIRSIVEGASLTMGDAADTQPTHKALVQYDASDWDFILSRADAQGLAVVVRDGTLSLKKLAVDGDAVRTFSFGLDAITDIHFELDAATQSASVSGLVWDPDQLAAASPADASVLALPQGNIGITGGDALGIGPAQLTHMVPLPAAEARTWATSRMARERLALIRGRISVPGIPQAQPMEVASLKGFGDRLNGNALVTGVRHRLDSRGLSTELQFGLSPDPVGRLPDIVNMQAGGLLPPISGLQLGTVHDTKDPDGQGRVQVAVPAILTDPPGFLWARIASPDAGNQRGFCFLPEVGDEVLVGFVAGDPRYPVVLGCLHGSKNTLPDGFKDVQKKGIISKRDARLVFSEADKPSITISTPDGRTAVLDDDAKTITLSDKNNNKITLDANGITIESGKDLTLKAQGAVKTSGSTIDLN